MRPVLATVPHALQSVSIDDDVRHPVKPTEPKTAVVTGASGGIGACIVRECARRGMHVLAIGRDGGRLQAVTAACSRVASGQRIVPMTLDLLDITAVPQIVDTVAAHGLDADLLVNCAGRGLLAPWSTSSPSAQLDILRLNFEAPVTLTRALLPTLIERRGAVLNIASIAAYLPLPNLSMLAASKAALLNWSVALRQEVLGSVSVTVFCPGITRTTFLDTAGMGHLRLDRPLLATGPEVVACKALDAVARNRAVAFATASDALAAAALKVLPSRLTASVAARVLRTP